MNKKSLLALLLALCMMLSSCALVVTDQAVDDATPIVTVGDKVYTKVEVKAYVENYLTQLANTYYQNYGYTIDTTSESVISNAQDTVMNGLVQQEVLAAKAVELGVDALTEEENAEVEETWQQYCDLFGGMLDEDLTDEERENAVIYYIYLYTGYTSVDDMKDARVQQKLYEKVVENVVVTEEELQAALDEQVESAKTTYASNLSAYGTAVNNGTTVYYRPAGYRMVKNLLVQISSADQTLIDALETRAEDKKSEATQLLTSIATYGEVDVNALVEQVSVVVTEVEPTPAPTTEPTEEPTAEPTEEPTEESASEAEETEAVEEEPTATPDADAEAVVPELTATVTDTFEATEDETQLAINQLVRDYMAARTISEEYERLAEEATDAAFAKIDARADEVLAKLAEGGDWDALMAEYTDDPGMKEGRTTAETGYAVCEGFSSFDSAFVEAAMSLANVGSWSDKVRGESGYYIIQYAGEVQEGAVTLDEVRDALEKSVLSEKQQTVYSDTVAQWVADSGAVLDKESLNR